MDNEWLCRKRYDDEQYSAKSFNSAKKMSLMINSTVIEPE